jgi:hypothetical protein
LGQSSFNSLFPNLGYEKPLCLWENKISILSYSYAIPKIRILFFIYFSLPNELCQGKYQKQGMA